MPYEPTADDILKVRMEVQDVTLELPVLSDSTYEYILTKHNGSIAFASLDAARMILMRLSFNSDETIDVLSLKSSKVATNWAYALAMFIKNPELNPIMRTVNPYAGGISNADIQTNQLDADQNTVLLPDYTKAELTYSQNMFSL